MYQLFKEDWGLGTRGREAEMQRGRGEKLTVTAPLLPCSPSPLLPWLLSVVEVCPSAPNLLHTFRIFLLIGSKPLENRVLSS
ncbi:hypothetical protein NSTCB13_03208 [Nostoc sp. DSM 114160]|jgi:hypothetical protein